MFIQDIYPPIYLCTSCRWSGNSAFVPGHLPRHQGCVFQVFRIFSETITWTPGLFFSGFLHIVRTCTAFLPVCDIFIRDIYPENYLCTSCRCSGHFVFSQDNYPNTWVVLFRFSTHLHVLGMCRKPEKKQPGVRVIVPGKVQNFRSIFGMYTNNLVVTVLNKYVTHM